MMSRMEDQQDGMDADVEHDLINAVKNNNESEVTRLINAGTDVNQTEGESGKTALFYAVQQSNNESVVRALIDAGADVNTTDNTNSDQTNLFEAIQQRFNQSVVCELISACPDVNTTDNEGRTALFYAVEQSNNENVVLALIDAGADVNRIDKVGKTALFYAVQQSNNKSVVRALIDAGADVNTIDSEGKTALFYANKNHNVSMACKLIDEGSDFSISEIDAKGVLLIAVRNGKTEVVRKLIRAGVDVDDVDGEGKNALFEAVCSSNETIVHVLVEEGKAFVNARDLNGRTPLFYAITKSTEIASYLFERAIVNDSDLCSILQFFLENCSRESDTSHPPIDEVLKLLEDNGLKPKRIAKSIVNIVLCKIPLLLTSVTESHPSENSLTSIQIQWTRKMESLINVLKQVSTYVETTTDVNKEHVIRMLELIEGQREDRISDVFSLLKEFGANPNCADIDGNTAFHNVMRLPFWGVSQKTVMDLCERLYNFGVPLTKGNYHGETPLLFCLSRSLENLEEDDKSSAMKTLVDVCTFLVHHGSNIEETTKRVQSVFHLIIRHFQQGLEIRDEKARNSVIDEALKLLELFSSDRMIKGNTVNKRDFHLNSPLHYWASLAPSPNYSSSESFSDTQEKILQHLLKLGTTLNTRNEYEETPLHLCKTWTAVKRLLNVGANPNDVDSSGSPPLLVAAKKNLGISLDHLYPDVPDDPKTFWRTAVHLGLDPWTVNKHGECVFTLLVKSEALISAEALVNVSCEKSNAHIASKLSNAYIKINDDYSKPALFHAVCQCKNECVVRTLIDAGADVNKTDNKGKTPLFYAVQQSDNESVVRALIDAGADVNRTDNKGKTALFYAVQQSNNEVVRALIDAGVDVNTIDNEGETALFYAVQKRNNENVVRALIDAGADVNKTDKEGKTALFYAVRQYNNENMVRALIDASVDVNTIDKVGKTALFYAVRQSNNENMVRALIDAKADVNTTDNKGKTPLFYAVQQSDNESVVRALIDAGADVNRTDNEGKTPVFNSNKKQSMDVPAYRLFLDDVEVHYNEAEARAALFDAARNDTPGIIKQLHDAGLGLNITDDDGKTALALAVENNSIDALCELIDCGAKFELDEIDGKAVLFYAAENKDFFCYDLVERLLRKGIFKSMADDDVIEFLGSGFEDYYTEDGVVYESIVECDLHRRTVLFWAAKNDFDEVVWRLHDAGLDLDITDDDGKTAVALAVENNSMDVLCELINLDAKFELDEIDGKAVLFYAAKNGRSEIVSKLYHAGLDVNVTDDDSKTAVFYANMYDSKDVLCELIECGADFHLEEIDGKAALFHAVEYGINMNVVVSKLLSAGLNVNITDNCGKTALFYAVQNFNNQSVVRALIDAGADVKVTDNQGKTALFYAVHRDAIDAIIQEDEIIINARDQYGRTALFYAVNRYSMTAARYLIEKGGNLYLKDKCSVTIFAFFIEKFTQGTLTSYVSELFQEQRQLNSLADAVLDVIFCQAPLLSKSKTFSYLGREYIILENKYVLEALTFARNQRFSQDDDKREAIDEISSMISEDKVDVPSILAWLNTLDVNPDAADSDGNTALHYAALLPHYGASQETVIDICKKLKDLGAIFDVKNQQQQSPLLLCLSSLNWDFVATEWPWDKEKASVRVCRFLLNNGSSVNETSQTGESAFHLLMKFVRRLFNRQEFDSSRPDVLQELIDLLELVSSKALERGKEKIAKKTDDQLNSPLHLWASLTLPSSTDYSSRLTKEHTFKNILQLIRDILLECGAKLNPRNENEDTPLHLCKTWAAVKLLIDAGANPNDLNSSKRSPLLVAAKEKTYLQKPGCFYPDVVDDPQTFWESVLQGGLDPWTTDKQGESVLSILVESEAFVLAKALIDVGIELKNIQSETKLALLCIICKDQSTRTHWKTNLVEIILKSAIKNRLPVDSALRLCCRNIVKYGVLDDKAAKNQKYVQRETKDEPNEDDGQPSIKKRRKEEEKEELNDDLVTFDSVHCKLAKQLLLYGVDISIRGSSGESCLDIAENCPALKDLLTKPIDIDSVPLLIPWTSVSSRYKRVMAKVARRQECEIVEEIWYHRNHIGSGAFGHIFAGINEKDGREVAIKRIERLRLQRPEEKREMQNLTTLADCQQVVRYVSFFEDQNFCYVVLELMEGNLEEYLNESTIDATEATLLCKDVVMGLKFLHEQNILHRDLKPQNILYKTHPKLCLKIADFGLSRRIDSSSSTSVYGTNAGTKCWIAPEIFKFPNDHSKSSDMFSCGLLLHYILSGQKHPFCPSDCANKSEIQVAHETEDNLMKGKMEEWDNSLSPEASHLVRKMIKNMVKNRPTAEEAIDHPLFWTKEKKIDFLEAVGNQPEFGCPRAKRMRPLSRVETDLESSLGAIVKYRSWNDSGYFHMSNVYAEMTRRRSYDTRSVVALVRFIRNAYAHIPEGTRPSHIRELLLEDFVFLEYFPALVMEVYKAVTTHGWDQTREEIKYAMRNK